MSEPQFQAYECVNPDCRIRFSSDLSVDHFDLCPVCRSPMKPVGLPYTNYRPPKGKANPAQVDVHLVLDNLRSILNVGSIFRTADGVGVRQIHCCGTTPTPDHPKFKKTSLGAETLARWSYHTNAVRLVSDLKTAGNLILALETTPNSISLFQIPAQLRFHTQPVVLVIGNEISGIDPGILNIADHEINIPMFGKKTSLNVAVSAGIALYALTNHLHHSSQHIENGLQSQDIKEI